MTRQAKATAAGSTEAGGSSRGLLRRAFFTRALHGEAKGRGALSPRSIGAPAVLLVLLVGLFTATTASAYYIPKLVEVNEVEYNSAHAVALASSDEFINGYAFEISTDGGTTWTTAAGGLYLGAADERPIEANLALKGGTHYAVRFQLGGVLDPKAPGPYPEFTTLPVTPPENVAVNAPTALLSSQAVLNGTVKRASNPNAAFNIECRYENISDAQLKENEANSLPTFEGAAVYPCAENPMSEPSVAKTVTAKIGCNHPNYTYFEGGCLTAATLYHTRLIAENGAPGSVAAEGTFTTLPAVAKPVILTANSATEVSYRSAKVSGSIERPAGADPALDVYCYFEYVTDAQFTATGFENANHVGCDQTPFDEFGMQHPITNAGPTPVTARLGGLKSGVTYHLRLGAENGSGLTTKDIPGTITTLPGGDLTYSVEPAKAIAGYTTLKLFGNVTYGLGPEAETEEIAYSFEFAEVGTENWSGCCAGEQAVPRGPGTKSVDQEFTRESGIAPNTEYKYRLVVPWAGGNYLEAITPEPYPTIKTKPLAEPSVAIDPVTSFTPVTAHFSGAVNPNAPGPLDELGKNAYKTKWEFQCVPGCPGPWSSGTVQGEEGSKAISVEALELHANTYYEVKLIAANAFYTVESPVQTFQTPLIAPTVASAAGASDGQGGFFLEGIVNSNNTKVTSCKFEYGTTATYPNTYEAPCLPSPSGPNEVQLINVEATSGQFKLGLRGQTTTDLPFDATPAEVQSALRALSKIGSNGVSVSGTVGAYKVTFSGGGLAGANVEQIQGGNGTAPLEGGGGIGVSTETEGGTLHAVSVEAHLEALTVGSTYHFRIVATSAGGTSTTGDRIFIPTLAPKEPTCPNEKIREENSSGTLPECRAYEMVTSPFKVGYAGEFQNFSDGEGTNVLYMSNAPNIAGSGEGFIGNRYIARRTPGGWETIPNRNGPSGSLLSPPNSVTGIGYFETNSFSADILSNLAPLATEHEPNLSIYIREASGLYVLVGHNADFSAGEELRGHSDDLSHSIFEGREGPYVSWGEGLYEFIGTRNDEPFRVDVNNAGEEVTDCNFDGGGGVDSQKAQGNSMSRDGRVIVYTARGCAKTTVFTPKVEKNQIWARVGLQQDSQVSYDLSASKCTRTAGDTGGACNAPADVLFEGSTPSGSRVFFSTTQQLVNADTDETRDLYACDIPPGEAAPTGLANSCSSLVQVSSAATGADVENLLHISADGKTAYFVAKGVLASNTDALGETALPGGHNLYVWHQDEAHQAGQTTFVGTLDENDLVSQITLSGRYLAFTTRSSLVPTDTDTSRDAYRYDDESGELTRISTAASGTGGNGEFDVGITGAGPGPQSGGSASAGAISEDGTNMVFTTEEALSPLDGNKGPDAYIWSESEPEEGHIRGHVRLISTGAAKGGSTKVVMTPSGRDIYFDTPAALTPPDGNLLTDVYDARVGGGFSFAQASCSGEGCRPSAAPAPVGEKAPSSAQPGSGNPPHSKTCSKGKVLKGGKCVAKKPKKKKHGHKKAHKRAGSNGGGGK